MAPRLRTVTLDVVVVPVHNEQAVLAASMVRLHRHLSAGFPYAWQVTIVDNASTDRTLEIAHDLATILPSVRAVRLDRKPRGLALRTAWSQSEADIVAYLDVDLSTDLDALLPLVARLVGGYSDVAIGSRLAAGVNVARGPTRELVSRSCRDSCAPGDMGSHRCGAVRLFARTTSVTGAGAGGRCSRRTSVTGRIVRHADPRTPILGAFGLGASAPGKTSPVPGADPQNVKDPQ